MSTKVTQLVHDLVSQGRWDEAHSVLLRWSTQQPEDPETQFQVGSLCYTIGRFPDAEQHLRTSLSQADNPDAHYYLGLTLTKLNRPAEAMGAFREACEKKENFATGHLHWGLALSQMGSFRGALGQYRQALKLNPKLVAAAYQAGIASFELGQFSDAVEFFAEACEKDQQLAEAFNGLGVSLCALDQYDKALSCFQRAWQLNDKLPSTKRNWASALVSLGRSDEAVKHYQEAINLGPKILEAKERALLYNDWGVNLFKQGRSDEAAEKLLQAVDIDPGLIEGRLNLGIVNNSMQEYEQAADAFEKAWELQPEDPLVNLHLGISYFLLGRYEESLQCLSRGASAKDSASSLDVWMGYAHMALGNIETAEHHFEKALREEPEDIIALDALGTCYAAQQRHVEACGKFTRCLELNEGFALAHIHLARSLEACGQASEAAVELRAGIEKDPGCIVPEKELMEQLLRQSEFDLVLAKSMRLLEVAPQDEDAQLALARALRAQNRLDDASQVLAHTMAMFPDNDVAHVLQGQIYLAQGLLLEADEQFRIASLINDGDVLLYFGWGKTLALLGLHELALEKFQKANEIDPYDSDTYEAWGATLKALGRFQEASDVFKRAAEYIR